MSEIVVAWRMLLQLRKPGGGMFFSPVRGDRSGAQIHDELMAYAFCFANGLRYGGPAGGRCDCETNGLRMMLGLPDSAAPTQRVNLLSRLYRDDTGSRAWRVFLAWIASRSWSSKPPSSDDMIDSAFLTHLHQQRYAETSFDSKPDVVIHIRRGDVSQEAHPERYVPIKSYVDFLNAIRGVAPSAQVVVHPQLKHFSFADIRALECLNVELKLDAPLHEAWRDMMNARVFLMARSSFSYVPALFNKGLVIYQCFWHQKRSSWLDFELCKDPVVVSEIQGPMLT